MENVYGKLGKRAVCETADEIKIANFKIFRQNNKGQVEAYHLMNSCLFLMM